MYSIRYGADTAFCLDVIRHCEKFGILKGCRHKYYINPKSDSHTWDKNRVIADNTMYELGLDFLKTKIGAVSPRNEEFLLLVYMAAIRDTLNVLWKSDVSDAEKLAGVLDIFSHEYTKQLAAREHLGASFGDAAELARQRSDLFAAAAKWLLAREEVPDGQVEQYCNVGEFTCAAAENADGWVFFRKLRAQFWIENGRAGEARAELDELAQLLPGDEEVASLRSQLL